MAAFLLQAVGLAYGVGFLKLELFYPVAFLFVFLLELFELLCIVDERVNFCLPLLHLVLEVYGILLDLSGHFCDYSCFFFGLFAF